MSYLYLPKSKKSLVAAMIQHLDEVEVAEDNPAAKSGKRTVPAINVTMIGAHLIEEVVEGDETQEVPYYETFTGVDVEVLLAWRDSNLIRQLPSRVEGEAVELPLPRSLEMEKV